MKQQAFEERYAREWADLERWLELRERRLRPDRRAIAERRGAQPAERAPFRDAELPHRYRRLCHQLALARDRRYGADLVERLHRLALEIHQILYGARTDERNAWLGYIFGGFARNVRAHWPVVVAAMLLFVVPYLGMIAVARHYPDAIYYLMSGDDIAKFEEMYGPAAAKLGRRAADSDFHMFGFYIFNNVRIAFQMFAGGLIFGVGAVFFLVLNGLIIGAVEGHVTALGFGTAFHSFVAGHSALELTAFVLSGAAGLLLGVSLISPDQLTRRAALAVAGREAAGIMYGVAGMLFAAAFIEAFWSSITVIPPLVKYGVGFALGAGVLAYFLFAGRDRAA